MTNKISRRTLLKGLGIGTGAMALNWQMPILNLTGELGPTRAQASSNAQSDKPWYDLEIIGEDLMDERLIFYLGHSWYKMSDIGECLDTASRIEPGNSESWRTEWYKTADRLKAVADESLAKGHKVSAGETYLRATSYYLAGLIYTDSPDNFDMARTVRASAESFESALELLNIPGTPVKIPYENSFLPGYFFRSPYADDKAPTIIYHQGMDASIEETYFIAEGAIQRGYHALAFHHPGQGLALRENGLTFRPDWENVITPVVDFAVGIPEVDADNLILLGLSFGGALVTRAVAFEKRIKICIANPAVYNWWESISATLFGDNPELEAFLDADPEGFDAMMPQFLENAPPLYTWWMNASMWKFGASSPSDLLLKLREYTNAEIADKVTCHMLVMDGEQETWAGGQAKRLYDALECPKDYLFFEAESTALLHNQTGALAIANQRMFDWLDEHI